MSSLRTRSERSARSVSAGAEEASTASGRKRGMARGPAGADAAALRSSAAALSAGKSAPVWSMTTNVRSRVSVWSRPPRCSRNAMVMKTGMRTSPMRNAFDRVSVTNSEEATTLILCIRPASRDADEDVVERRACDLEVIDGRARGQLLQERLRIAGEADFLELTVVVNRFDARQAGQRRRAAGA